MIASEAEAQDWLRAELGVDDAAMARLGLLVDMLLAENERQNLVARGTLPHVWQRHILDSAQLLHVSRETLPDGTWLDLGTGAGFPGLVAAALQPERPFVLVDSRRLRTEWLQRAADALGLTNVRAVLSRVEDLPSGPHAVISARAFAPLDKLVTLSARFSTPDTFWLLPKGAGAQHELQVLPESWRHVFHVKQSLTDPDAGIIVGRLLEGKHAATVASRSSKKAKRS
ncbi:16S rRNA (guanine(527)-N(7))-methyltransferase RsmG [Novosphingobium sp. AAP83]|nr:16S rRNA (guanine(527)-N(7))-methyltransferase RsmG [Novosphingobium sp. AAP83]KPF89037.1 16S rRNA (guanine(527)-N(7))-methyltransferase RsmG [Novosphingobium sp. AAP83]